MDYDISVALLAEVKEAQAFSNSKHALKHHEKNKSTGSDPVYTVFKNSRCLAQKVPASATEDWSRKPVKVRPAKDGSPPSDAIILFSDKKDLAKWEHPDGSPVKWQAKDNTLVVEKKTGNIRTKQAFGSVQLHVEWKTPDPKEDRSTSRGNSGVFLMDLYELQI
jgi:hypothetical protein